jgi:hypothetical protein
VATHWAPCRRGGTDRRMATVAQAVLRQQSSGQCTGMRTAQPWVQQDAKVTPGHRRAVDERRRRARRCGFARGSKMALDGR